MIESDYPDEEIDLTSFRVTIPAENWNQIVCLLNAPPRDIPALRKLMETKPIWLD